MDFIFFFYFFYFGKKRVVLKGLSRNSRLRFWSELAGILCKIEDENTMEKHLKVFQAHSLQVLLLAVQTLSAVKTVVPQVPIYCFKRDHGPNLFSKLNLAEGIG